MLGSAHEVQRFHRYGEVTWSLLSLMCHNKEGWRIRLFPCPLSFPRDADETKEWIEEKNQALNTDNYGHDLASVQALQRKHEGFERDLAALGDKVCDHPSPTPHWALRVRLTALHPCPGQLSGGDGRALDPVPP